jgi:hypothetical protein
MSFQQRSTLRQRLFAFVAAGVGGTLAAGISFAMSVYDAANPDPTPVAAVGEPVDAGRWIVTIHGARIGSVPPTGVPPSTPTRLVMVDLDLDNRSAETSNVFHRLLSFEPPAPQFDGPMSTTFYLARDNGIAGGINPGMPERLIAAWEWPEGQPLPETLRIRVTNHIYKRRDNLYGAPGWFERDAAAVVEVPVSHDATEAAP